MGNCPRCGTRLLPGALACINCDLPIAPDTDSAQPADAAPPPYSMPAPGYSPYAANPNWPPYGAPQPGYPQPGSYSAAPGPAPWTTNGLSIAGLVLGIIWLGGLGSLLAVIFGHVSKGQIRRHPQRGAGMSLAALIIGYLGLVGSVIFYAELPNIVNSAAVQNIVVQQDMKDAASAERNYLSDTGSYTSSAVDLRDHGFNPSTLGHNTILAAYNSDIGFCLVGAHDGGNTWYLYDSRSSGLSDFSYGSADAAESACTVNGVGDYAAIA